MGIEQDQPRIADTAEPCGPEANFGFNLVRQRVTKLADMPREHAATARDSPKKLEFNAHNRPYLESASEDDELSSSVEGGGGNAERSSAPEMDPWEVGATRPAKLVSGSSEAGR